MHSTRAVSHPGMSNPAISGSAPDPFTAVNPARPCFARAKTLSAPTCGDEVAYSFATIASANAEHLTSVAPSIKRAKS